MPEHPAASKMERMAVQWAALGFAIAFLLIGVAGFIPGITTNYDQLEFSGPRSQAMLFGVFQVSWLHNFVHVSLGVIGAGMAATIALATGYLIAGGLLFLIAWLYGLVVNGLSAANFLPVNEAGNWLHLLLALGMFGVGAALGARSRAAVSHQ